MGKLITPKSTTRRRHIFEANMIETFKTLEESAKEKEVEKMKSVKEDVDFLATSIDNDFKIKTSKSKSLVEQEEIFHENFSNCISGLVSLVVVESLLLDEEEIGDKKETIFNTVREEVKKLYEEDVIKLSESPVFTHMAGQITGMIDRGDEKLNDDELANVISSIYVNNPDMIDPLKDSVQDKVVSAVSDEKELIKVKQNLNEDQIFVAENIKGNKIGYSKPLFRKLIENVIIGNEEDLLAEEVNLGSSMSQAILEYTLAETLNTSNLIKIDMKALREAVKY